MHQGERGQAQVGLGFAATGGEEEQFNGLTIQPAFWAIWCGETRQVHQHKGQLEEAPLGAAGVWCKADLIGRHLGAEGTALPTGAGHHQVHGAEGLSHQGIAEQLDPVFNAPGAVFCLGPELLGGFVLSWVANRVFGLLGDPAAVGLHHRHQLLPDPFAAGQIR